MPEQGGNSYVSLKIIHHVHIFSDFERRINIDFDIWPDFFYFPQ